MRLERMRLTRRAMLCVLGSASLPAWERPALADPRTTAQAVGIDQRNVGLLADPRALLDGKGTQPLIWGGRERCDPTDAACAAGGQLETGDQQQPVPSKPLEASAKVAFDVSIAGQLAGTLTVGLDRSAGPASVETFLQLCRGTLISREDQEPASFQSSKAASVQRDKVVVLGDLTRLGGSLELVRGRTKPLRVPVQPPSNDDTNTISHDQAGLLSVRRGGGSFQFMLTPRANPDLDRDNLVIGKIIDEDGMQLLARLNSLPVNNYDGAPLAKVQVSAVRVQ